jgi:hypothetical protein
LPLENRILLTGRCALERTLFLLLKLSDCAIRMTHADSV